MTYRIGGLAALAVALGSAVGACDKVECPAGTVSIEGNCSALPTGMDDGAMIGTSGTSATGGTGADGNGMLTGGESQTGTAAAGAAPSGAAGHGAAASDAAASGAAASSGGAAGNDAAASGAAASSAADGGSRDGSPSGCTSGSETCDNLDNDCDQKIDEGVTRTCGSSMMGVCKQGTEQCVAGGWSGNCEGAIEPGMEVCDAEGLDENCNGTPNENCACTPGMTQRCGVIGGNCVQGSQTCDANGQWSAECVGAVPPATEVCDGSEDEDCDGDVDEGCECTNGKTMPCGVDIGECAIGTKTCEDGQWSTTCSGERKPGSESCDGKDNDCDGKSDEGLLNECGGCRRLTNPPGSTCSAGEFACRASGTYQCSGRDATTCSARARQPGVESCNSQDDDCDGASDEGLENACGGPCRTRLPGSPGDSCTISGAGSCSTGGEYQCAGATLRCAPKCWYLCVVADSPATRTQDPCSWTARGPETACVPEDPNCF